MADLRVERWTSAEEAWGMEAAITGMGGVYVAGMSWDAYLAKVDPQDRPYLEAVKARILKDEVKVSGEECADRHVPVFSDGTACVFTPAGWADLLAAIWGGSAIGHYTHRTLSKPDDD